MIRRLFAHAVRAAVALAAVGAFAATAQAAPSASPAWRLNLASNPTNFAPGASRSADFTQYTLMAINIGGAATTEPITVTDTLPEGVTLVGASGSDQTQSSVSCVLAAPTVTCTDPGPVHPGQWMEVEIDVDVDPLAEGSTIINQATVSGGGAVPATAATTTTISSTPASFDFLPAPAGLGSLLAQADGSPATQAGSHPDQLTIDLGFPSVRGAGTAPLFAAGGGLRDLSAYLPRGLVLNPNASPVLCTEAQLEGAGCPDESAVGTMTVLTTVLSIQPQQDPLYNMVPPPGTPAELGFDAAGAGIYVHVLGGVRSNGDYGLVGASKDILSRFAQPVFAVRAQLWGDPSSPTHDHVRGACARGGGTCPVEAQSTAFLTAPSACSDSLTIEASADAWGDPGNFHDRSARLADAKGNPVGVEGCDQLEFKPSIQVRPSTNLADSPSGLDVTVHQPQNQHLESLSPAIMRDITLTLPEGMAVNPSSADGLGVCTEEQANVASLEPSDCPDAAKVGSVEVTTPLLNHPLPGALYVAKPFANPSGSLIALYLAVHDPETGVVANLPGEVRADPSTGQLRNTFEENPELPIEDIRVHLFTGPRAPLRTPPICGTHTSRADMRPWSTPEGADAHPTDSFEIAAAPGGGACPSTAGAAPNAPAFNAGTVASVAGAYSPFVLKASREDASQPLAGIEATMPPGLTGKLAGIATCSEAQISAAKAREKPEQGKVEQASPSCPASSEVATVDVAAGAGATPLHAQGHAYLAGPYKGAPISLAIVTPAVAGPFDLGAVVVRTALYVNSQTAQIHAVSDPLPQILDGIPLDLRSVVLRTSRPDFTLNPTSCNPFAVVGTLTSALGQGAAVKSPFQVGGCPALPFKPKLDLRLKGATKRADHPKLIATLSAKGGEANVARASVQLPRSAFLDQAHIRTVCTRVQFAADACPKGSIYGTATATTPLLDYPISGNVYLRSSNNKLPDLVIDLRGPAYQPLRVELAGRTDSVKGALRNTFDVVPDAPVSEFRLELFGGKRGLIVNSRNLCAKAYRATVQIDGQNGKTFDSNPAVKNDCKPRHRRKGKGHKAK